MGQPRSAQPDSPVEVTTSTKGSGDDRGSETTVTARRPVTAASSSTVRDRDLKLRPRQRPADVLQVTPGLFVVQHAGGGKANQYFLRGYDADHGTDVALYVDGIPVNQVSHGHGQGYSDLHWLILETVERVEVLKGTFFPQLGDFATAGAISLHTRRRLPASQVTVAGGMFGTLRGLGVYSGQVMGMTPLIAIEGYQTDGPFRNPEKTRRYNVFSKFTKDWDLSQLHLGVAAYSGRWNASGQLPEREVNAGRLDRFGSLDPTEGGDSNRYSVFGKYTWRPSAGSSWDTLAYVTSYHMSLFSNFTFFSADPINGDQIQQTDQRVTIGADTRYRFHTVLLERPWDTVIGLQYRQDDIVNGLFRTKARARLGTVSRGDILQRSVGAYVGEEVGWAPWVRSVVALRGDYYWFDLRGTGHRGAGVVSPKASLIVTPVEQTDLFLNYGQGFHSNDARGIFDPLLPAKPLNKVFTYELGARTRLWEGRLDLAGAFFWQESDGEIVYVGDAGGTENKGPSRRLGAELEARLRLLDWLYWDTDINLIQPELRGLAPPANAIPYAPTRILTGGLSAEHPGGYYGRLGFFSIGDRPATEDRFLTAQGFTRFDLTVGYRRPRFEVSLALQNLFNTKWREAQFATVSRLPGETAASCPASTRPVTDGSGAFLGCEDIHFTPGSPLNVQASATVFF